MKKRRTSFTITAGFLVMGLFILLSGFTSTYGIFSISKKTEALSDVYSAVVSLEAMRKDQAAMRRLESALLVFKSEIDERRRSEYIGELEKTRDRFEENLNYLAEMPSTLETSRLLRTLAAAHETVTRERSALLDNLEQNSRQEAIRLAWGSLEKAHAGLEAVLEELAAAYGGIAADAFHGGTGTIEWAAIGLTLAGVAAAAALYLFYSNRLVAPIGRVVATLGETADQLNEAAEQISISGNHLAERASTQASAVEESSALIEDVTAHVNEYVEQVNTMKSMFDALAGKGMKAFELLGYARKALKVIGKSNEDTLPIVTEIERIAFQTNFLALSASVEAARAGEAGTGFTVVSQEVRDLGARSTDAARTAMTLIDETIRVTEEGNGMVGAARKQFIEYGTATAPLANYAESAFELADRQKQSLERISESIQHISESARSNVQGALEAARAADETKREAAGVTRVVEELAAVVR